VDTAGEGTSSSEEEEEEEEEDEDEEEEDVRDEPTMATYENFFHLAARKKKSLTSNNTLSLLPMLTPQECTALLANIPDHHAAEIQNLHEAHRQQFPQWRFEIDNGYNVILFGYGSKRSLIEEFGREELADDMSVLVINGYIPSISLDSILTQILAHIAPDLPSTGDKLHLVQTHLSQPLALLIHSLDSPVLRAAKNQQILSTLAGNKYVSIVASVDHVNAPLLFDSLKASRYNFLWHDCTTFVPLRTELSYEGTTFLGGGSQPRPPSAVSAVSRMFLIILLQTRENSTDYCYSISCLYIQIRTSLRGWTKGFTFSQLRGLCAKKILPLSNPTTLRGLLGEFF
jgi:origin recognition complex subunit 2